MKIILRGDGEGGGGGGGEKKSIFWGAPYPDFKQTWNQLTLPWSCLPRAQDSVGPASTPPSDSEPFLGNDLYDAQDSAFSAVSASAEGVVHGVCTAGAQEQVGSRADTITILARLISAFGGLLFFFFLRWRTIHAVYLREKFEDWPTSCKFLAKVISCSEDYKKVFTCYMFRIARLPAERCLKTASCPPRWDMCQLWKMSPSGFLFYFCHPFSL